MDGLGWLIKSLCDNMGIKLDPDDIKKSIELAKVLIPRIAEGFDTMNATLKRLEAKIDLLDQQINGLTNDPIAISVRASQLTEQTEVTSQ